MEVIKLCVKFPLTTRRRSSMASHIVLNDRGHGFHGFTMRMALMEESCLTVLPPLLENLMTIIEFNDAFAREFNADLASMSISEQNLETSNHQTSNSKPIHFIFLNDFVQKISRGIRFQLTGIDRSFESFGVWNSHDAYPCSHNSMNIPKQNLETPN